MVISQSNGDISLGDAGATHLANAKLCPSGRQHHPKCVADKALPASILDCGKFKKWHVYAHEACCSAEQALMLMAWSKRMMAVTPAVAVGLHSLRGHWRRMSGRTIAACSQDGGVQPPLFSCSGNSRLGSQ